MPHVFMRVIAIFFFGVVFYSENYAQPTYQYTKHWVAFTDKNNSPFSIQQPSVFLSQRAIERRQEQNITIDETDFPVNPQYVAAVEAAGASIIHRSRWMNAVTIETSDSLVLAAIGQLPFVQTIEPVYRIQILNIQNPEAHTAIVRTESEINNSDYGDAFHQLQMLHGDFLHRNGFKGGGKVIAVLDAGFVNIHQISAFDSLFFN